MSKKPKGAWKDANPTVDTPEPTDEELAATLQARQQKKTQGFLDEYKVLALKHGLDLRLLRCDKCGGTGVTIGVLPLEQADGR